MAIERNATQAAQLSTLYNIFIKAEMNRLLELLEDAGETENADRVVELNRELRALCKA